MARLRDADRERHALQNGRAARTVASHSLDARDCEALLAMLGLEPADGVPPGPPTPW